MSFFYYIFMFFVYCMYIYYVYISRGADGYTFCLSIQRCGNDEKKDDDSYINGVDSDARREHYS